MLNRSARPKRILIVDDESTLVFFLQQGIQEAQMTCTVEVASSGEDALRKLTHKKFDLVITDLKMPGINGFSLIEAARSLHPQLKTIVMTAFGSRQVEEEIQNLGIDGYLNKPFPTADLIALIQNILFAKDNVAPDLIASKTNT
jgi:YesN/AraC family two-component response regulator